MLQLTFAPLLKFRRKFGHGMRVAWYRDVVRPRILSTPPIQGTTDQRCEIHVLTCAADWLNLIWALKSFYVASDRRYALCIHEDGSLGGPDLAELQRHFPAARIIRRAEADAKLAEKLNGYPLSHAFRKVHPLAPKLFDFTAFLESERMVILDSDLLFFAEPTEFLHRIEEPTYRRNSFNADAYGSGYTTTTVAKAREDIPWYLFDGEAVRAQIGHDLLPRINGGFGLVHRDSIRLDWLEEFLALPGIQSAFRNFVAGDSGSALQFLFIEQTLFALCSSRYGVEHLPEEYNVRLEPGLGSCCVRHYIGPIRHLMYGEGIERLVRQRFLSSL